MVVPIKVEALLVAEGWEKPSLSVVDPRYQRSLGVPSHDAAVREFHDDRPVWLVVNELMEILHLDVAIVPQQQPGYSDGLALQLLDQVYEEGSFPIKGISIGFCIPREPIHQVACEVLHVHLLRLLLPFRLRLHVLRICRAGVRWCAWCWYIFPLQLSSHGWYFVLNVIELCYKGMHMGKCMMGLWVGHVEGGWNVREYGPHLSILLHDLAVTVVELLLVCGTKLAVDSPELSSQPRHFPFCSTKFLW